jgi:hypothetical protein
MKDRKFRVQFSKTQTIISENRTDIQLSVDSQDSRTLAGTEVRTLSVGSTDRISDLVIVVGKNLLGGGTAGELLFLPVALCTRVLLSLSAELA